MRRFREALALAREHPADFTLQYPPRREYFQESFRSEADWGPVGGLRQLLLYLHVPFCATRCHYCNFAVDVRRDELLHARVVEGLVRQLDALGELISPGASIPGIDIGGGTPTVLSDALLARLLSALVPWRARCSAPHPLSIETTPRIAATLPARMNLLHEGGIDRISIGIQTTYEDRLAAVNRHGQIGMNRDAMRNLRAAGFRRINVDLIFGLPNQDAAAWRMDLDQVIALAPDSITTYDCLYRGKGRHLRQARGGLPAYGRLYDLGHDLLGSHGFHAPYGGVTFSRHVGETGTSPYFEGRLLDGMPYLGLGNYASSWFADSWVFAPHGVDDWLAAVAAGRRLPSGDAYRLPVAERAAKYALLSLSFGMLEPTRFQRAIGEPLLSVFGDAIAMAVEEGLLVMDNTRARYAIPHGGFARMPELRSLFYSAEAVAWMQRIVARG